MVTIPYQKSGLLRSKERVVSMRMYRGKVAMEPEFETAATEKNSPLMGEQKCTVEPNTVS